MSSANRGSERSADDFYQSPHWIVEAMIPRIKHLLRDVENPRIWEPCAGAGRITRVLKHFFPEAIIYASDIGDFDGIDERIDFLQCRDRSEWDLIISNPPFCLALECIQHAQSLVTERGHVLMLERLNFWGTKKREKFLFWDPPHTNISPRRASFLPSGKCDSIEYGFFEFQSTWRMNNFPKEFGETRLLPTMLCWGCGDVQYNKACAECNYGYCKDCAPEHDCKRNLFGKDALWYCYNHPERPMTDACRAKGCSLPFCAECWAEHAQGKWRACMVDDA